MLLKNSIQRPSHIWTLYGILLSILGLIAYYDAFSLSVETHDREYMIDAAASGILDIFSADKHMPGRPFFELLVWMEYQFWQDDVRYFHIAGIVLHIGASYLLAIVLSQRNIALSISLTAGFLFLLNTAHFRAIHWISAHCYSLSLLCGFAAMYCFYRWLQSNHWHLAILTYVATIAGVLSHISTAVILPVLLLDTRLSGQQAKRPIWFISFLSISALLCIFFIKSHYTLAPQVDILTDEWTFYEPLIQFVYLLGRLISTLHWLPFALYEPHSWDYALGAAGICAALILIIRYPSQINIYGLLWLFGGLVPFLLIDFHYIMTMSAGPSRYLYMAGVGAAILLAQGIRNISLSTQAYLYTNKKTEYSRIPHAAIVLTVAFSSIFYHAQSEAVSLYTSARNDLANGYTGSGVSQLQEVVERNSTLVDLKDTYERLFTPLTRMDLSEAAHVVAQGRKRFPESRDLILGEMVLQSLQATDIEQDEIVESIALLGQDSEISNLLNGWYHNVSELKMKNSDLTAAVAALDILIRTTPKNSTTTLWNSAVLFIRLGAYDTARKRLEEILASGSTEANVLYLLARMCIYQNDLTSAEIHVNKLLEIDPLNNEALALKEYLLQKTQPKQ